MKYSAWCLVFVLWSSCPQLTDYSGLFCFWNKAHYWRSFLFIWDGIFLNSIQVCCQPDLTPLTYSANSSQPGSACDFVHDLSISTSIHLLLWWLFYLFLLINLYHLFFLVFKKCGGGGWDTHGIIYSTPAINEELKKETNSIEYFSLMNSVS